MKRKDIEILILNQAKHRESNEFSSDKWNEISKLACDSTYNHDAFTNYIYDLQSRNFIQDNDKWIITIDGKEYLKSRDNIFESIRYWITKDDSNLRWAIGMIASFILGFSISYFNCP